MRRLPLALLLLVLLPAARITAADAATFVRAINLNGPALTIDGRTWEAGASAPDFKATGKLFANQKVALKPPTDAARTEMIRSSVWGAKVELVVSNLPAGPYQVFLYVWEDNHDEQFDLLVNGTVVIPQFHSGSAGMWKKLGPWRAASVDGRLTVSARGASHGAANLSGLELWSGDGPIPEATTAGFVRAPSPEQVAFFESKIRPVLAENCYECHSATAKKLKGGLLLDSSAGVQEGGFTGPAITPGDPDASLIIQALRHTTEDVAMPPKKNSRRTSSPISNPGSAGARPIRARPTPSPSSAPKRRSTGPRRASGGRSVRSPLPRPPPSKTPAGLPTT